MSQTDLLLLNASNLPQRPIYPYAFVQVSAVARRFGLKVQRFDLLDVQPELWRPMLQALVERHRPRMIGLHLRQVDSIAQSDYYDAGTDSVCGSYFPVQASRALVRLVRELADVPVVVGGIGFTSHAPLLYDYLEVDYGVQGDPDGFFERFEDVVAARALEHVPGLIHRKNGTYQPSPRGFYSPAEEREYTDEIVDELVRFYGHAQLYGPNPPTVAVEIMRGCPFRCYFCTEPHVKGRRIDYRNIESITAEIEFLLSHNLRRFWFVCSELNIQGTDFAMSLGEEIIRLGERWPGTPIEWSGYSLPKMEVAELRTLQRAGYVGALNDVLSLDDDNLRRAQVPYRSHQAVRFLKAMASLADEERQSNAEATYAADDGLRKRLATRTPKELGNLLSLFLGNAHADEKTIWRTLQQIDDNGLRDNYRAGHVIASTRVFELEGQPICAVGDESSVISYGPQGLLEPDLRWPSFYYPSFLTEKLGSPPAIHRFFAYVSDTFLSNAYRANRNWNWFLSRFARPELLSTWLTQAAASPLAADAPALIRESATRILADAGVESVKSVLAPPPEEQPHWNQVAALLLSHILTTQPGHTAPVARHLEVPVGDGGEVQLSAYRFAEHLYRRYDSDEALIDDVVTRLDATRDSLALLYLRWLLYANNVCIRPEYRTLLFEPS
ncbi:B12-binding domain-containing radical SAM protein [Haliangium ochraceum]|uniref:Fe-S oxidoreductase-like protein n=1 Tax=Haliangium ochraceum (strain DSM 14365 / JCM 11303 / SMP-2) TaxID=502025 RepID=D0LTF7_HALO1|nr:B12-binding domain-containing radical SAM protein [Haliangium ochraceum]ACY13852.1 Fe-S oxidoreductase-like protein [Haliangium ochraceum DSM 14365]